jgi:plastocyanin
MRRSIGVALLAGVWVMGAAVAMADEKKVKVRDDCDPTDPAWADIGGCTLDEGAVTVDEFDLLLFSPLSTPSIIGHPAWTMDPSYIEIEPNKTVKVKNVGGRGHTFTRVADFGGGVLPYLNGTLTMAPECATATPQAPGARQEVTGLGVGDHRIQCCIHPWMRTFIKVEAEKSSDEDED